MDRNRVGDEGKEREDSLRRKRRQRKHGNNRGRKLRGGKMRRRGVERGRERKEREG